MKEEKLCILTIGVFVCALLRAPMKCCPIEGRRQLTSSKPMFLVLSTKSTTNHYSRLCWQIKSKGSPSHRKYRLCQCVGDFLSVL